MVRLILNGIRVVTPWIARAAMFSGMLVLTAVASLWTGIPNAVETIGREWEDRAYRGGIPTLYLPYIYHCARAVGLLTILAGWILFAYITMFVFWLVF